MQLTIVLIKNCHFKIYSSNNKNISYKIKKKFNNLKLCIKKRFYIQQKGDYHTSIL